MSRAKVLIVGDVMLDRFVYGDVRRISPEAPIPVLSSRSERSMAGGAANVARNVVSLGASATLIGVAADDAGGRRLRGLLSDGSIHIKDKLVAESGRPTTVKTRYVAGSQQLLRVDEEEARPVSAMTERSIIESFEQEVAHADIVALSDYGKGVLTDRVLREALSIARRAGKLTVVDPKRAELSAYEGADIIKPNLSELRRAVNFAGDSDESVEAAAREIVAKSGAALLVTRSQHGMSYFARGEAAVHVRAVPQEVFDVSGAGDTALAVFAAATAAGHSRHDAMVIANAASGIAVSKLGTAVVTVEELIKTVNEGVFLEPQSRVLGLDQAMELCLTWRNRGLRVGFTNGCFDILHAGHVSLLTKSASACDRLIVGLNSDASVRRLKGPSRPIQSELSRAQVLASLDAVDLVVVFDQETPMNLIEHLRPDVLIKGADYSEDQVVGGDFVKSYGGRVMLAEIIAGHSTTNAIKRAAFPQT